MEVKIDIMQAISEGDGRPTHIMYRSNLSWNVMRKFMDTLKSQGLVQESDADGRRNYSLTEKGVRVLQTYISVREQFNNLVAEAPFASVATPQAISCK